MAKADLTHVALHVVNLDASLKFYRDYASMDVVDERTTPAGGRVVWLANSEARLVLVLIGSGRMSLRHRLARELARRLPPASHLGVELDSREEVVRLCERARKEGILRRAPADHGPPVGFYGMLADPDGNNFELSYDQTVREVLDRKKE